MDILRRNTDYALRLMGNLAGGDGHEAVSVRRLAEEENVSYQFACKILQRLLEAGLVASEMGPSGGYRLARAAEKITILDVVCAVQGAVSVNRCTRGECGCPRQSNCAVNRKLCELQGQVDQFFANVTLTDIV